VYGASRAVVFVFIGIFVGVMVWTGRRLTLKGHPPRVPYFPAPKSHIARILGGCGSSGLAPRIGCRSYVGNLIALLIASVLVLAVVLILLARLAQRKSRCRLTIGLGLLRRPNLGARDAGIGIESGSTSLARGQQNRAAPHS
jgi:hypothetical protein